jgi:glycosyltransferase involved in cell wall biosynthesis
VNFLFVHQNFPGQYLHIVRSLLADNFRHDGTHQIVFMTEPNRNNIAGVRKVTYAKPPVVSSNVHVDAREFELATRRSQAAYKGALQIKALGFWPDIIIGHHGWGELLNLVDVFPGVPILGYFEFYYRIGGTDVNFDPEFPMPVERFSAVRSKNTVNLLAVALEQYGQVPTQWQYSTYPAWAREKFRIVEEGVDLEICKADAKIRSKILKIGPLTVKPAQKLLTYVARNLEPYRGFHTFMRALPAILKARPDVVVSIVGGDEISYGAAPAKGSWREVMLQELGNSLDLARINFLGKIPYEQHLALLKRSDAHVYLSYPFVASWSLREAMAVGCVIIGADTPTVTEFITHRETGLIVPTLDSARLTETVLEALRDTRLAARLRLAARAHAEKHLDIKDYLLRYRGLIEDITQQPLVPKPAASPRPAARRPRNKLQPATLPIRRPAQTEMPKR